MYSCLYYNINVAPSVTTQGRSLISSASLQFEMFLADNVKWSSLNDIITFIDNVVNEKNERVYDDRLILDRDIDRYECFYKIMVNCGFNYIPSEDDLDIVWSIICNLDQWDINRLYYKNNLYSFMDLPVMNNMMKNLLIKLEVPFLDPNKPNPEIKEDLDEFTNIIMEYVYYHHQIIDRMDRYSNMYRQVAVITDTDSEIEELPIAI